jgi:phytoene synthase
MAHADYGRTTGATAAVGAPSSCPIASPAEVERAYRSCQAYTRSRAKNFYYAFAALPAPKRRAIYAAYAFAGQVDDVTDGDAPLEAKTRELADYRRRLDACYAGQRPEPLFIALGDAADRFSLPREYFEELISGVEMDLSTYRYRTFEELRQYCYRVASVVGLICIQTFGHRPHPQATDFATDMGIALQLTNIMRDLQEDAGRGRIYLPLDELERFGYSESQLLRGDYNEAFRELMAFQAQRARGYFASGRRLLPLLSLRSRLCINVLQGVYFEILCRIEERRYNVFSERVSFSDREKLTLIGKLWLQALRPSAAPVDGSR